MIRYIQTKAKKSINHQAIEDGLISPMIGMDDVTPYDFMTRSKFSSFFSCFLAGISAICP